MTTGTPGIDVSHHQDRIDWQKVAAAGYRFAIIRASYGSTVKDRRFETHWDGARAAGLKVSSYHFLLPEQGAQAQMDFWFGILGSRKPDFPLCLDVEKNSTGLPKETMTSIVRDCLQRIEGHDGRKAILYTRASFWNRQLVTAGDWAQHDLWVAYYVNNPASINPGLPAGWSTYRFWQYSESGQVPGISGNVDLNYFNGSADDLLHYAGGSTTQPPVQPPSPSTGTGVHVIADSLNVRSGAGTQFPVVGQRHKNDAVTISALGGSDIWISFASGKWAAFTYTGQSFMELLPGSTPLQARVTANRLNVRLAPNATAPMVGGLNQGQTVTIVDIDGHDAWAGIGANQWAAITYNGSRYIALN
jgi:lysozyme